MKFAVLRRGAEVVSCRLPKSFRTYWRCFETVALGFKTREHTLLHFLCPLVQQQRGGLALGARQKVRYFCLKVFTGMKPHLEYDRRLETVFFHQAHGCV